MGVSTCAVCLLLNGWLLSADADPQAFTNSLKMQFVPVKGGTFKMGSPNTEAGRQADETLHSVRITKPFYLAAHEVTVGQFRAFVKSENYKSEAERDGRPTPGFNATANKIEEGKSYNWQNTGWAQGDDHPVVNVNWNDAREFCRWLSRIDGRKYRLPTEAEWEYACRAGSTTANCVGDNSELLASVGNVGDATLRSKFPASAAVIAAKDGFDFTAPVGKFKSNALGIFDMHGNVWEWCGDVYGDYASDAIDPRGAESGPDRVFRGGSWGNGVSACRSARRGHAAAWYRSIDIGFRIACDSASVREPPSDEAALIAKITPPTTTFKKLLTIALPENRKPMLLTFSADGSHILVCASNFGHVYNIGTGKKVAEHTLPVKTSIESCALSQDGKLALFGFHSGGAILWDAVTGVLRETYDSPQAEVRSTSFTRDGRWVMLGDSLGCLYRAPLSGGTAGGTAERILRAADTAERDKSSEPAERQGISSTGKVWAYHDPGHAALIAWFVGSDRLGRAEGIQGTRVLGVSDDYAVSFTAGDQMQLFGEFSSKLYSVYRNYTAVTFARDAQITENGLHTRALSNKRLETRLTRYPAYPLVQYIDPTADYAIEPCAICPTSPRVALVTTLHAVCVFESPPPDCDGWQFAIKIHRLIKDKQFAQLDAMADEVKDDPASYPWMPQRTKYEALLQQILEYPGFFSESTGRETVMLWQRARPDSSHPKVAHATSLYLDGGRYLAEEEEQIARALMEKSQGILEPLLRKGNAPPLAYVTMLGTGLVLGWSDKKYQPYVEQCLERYPKYPSTYRVLIERLLPVHGGSPGEAVKYAEEVARKVGGQEGEWLYALMGIQALRYYADQEFWFETKWNYERVQQAFLARLKTHPHDSVSASYGILLAMRKSDIATGRKFRAHFTQYHLTPYFDDNVMPHRFYVGLENVRMRNEPGYIDR